MIKPKKGIGATEAFVWRVFNYLDKKFEKRIDALDKKQEKRFDKVMVHLVDIAGKFQKFDEEKTIISHRVSIHEDRIEKLEETVLKTS